MHADVLAVYYIHFWCGRQHTAEVQNDGLYPVIYDQRGCNTRASHDELRLIDSALDDAHGKVTFVGGLPSDKLLSKLDSMLSGTETGSDGFMMVKPQPSYLIVKQTLVADFGQETFDACKKQVIQKLNAQASVSAAGSPSRAGGSAAAAAGAVVNGAHGVGGLRPTRPQPPWIRLASEYAALIGGGAAGPARRPRPPPAIRPMSAGEHDVDYALCERVLREAEEKKIAEAEKERLQAERKAAAKAQAAAEALSKRDAERSAAAAKAQADREAAAVQASKDEAARQAKARAEGGAREQAAARAVLQASRAGFDVDEDATGHGLSVAATAASAETNPFASPASTLSTAANGRAGGAAVIAAAAAASALPPAFSSLVDDSNGGGGGGGDAPPPAYNAVVPSAGGAPVISPCTSTALRSLPPALAQPPLRQRGSVTTVLTTNVSTGQVLQVKSGSILDSDCTAIVNAANSQLRHEGGIAAVIAKAAGPALYAECRGVTVPEGSAHLTTSGFLAANGPKHVLHAVAPAWYQRTQHESARQVEMMHSTVAQCLDKAAAARVDSVDFPALGTGIFGWPVNIGTREIAVAVVRWLVAHPHTCVKRVCFTDIDLEKVRLFQEAVDGAAAPGGTAGSLSAPAATGSIVGAGEWACAACTFVNKPNATVCDICGSPRA